MVSSGWGEELRRGRLSEIQCKLSRFKFRWNQPIELEVEVVQCGRCFVKVEVKRFTYHVAVNNELDSLRMTLFVTHSTLVLKNAFIGALNQNAIACIDKARMPAALAPVVAF